jgi:hypothetical protein
MDTPYNAAESKHTIALARPRLTFFNRCWAALLDCLKREVAGPRLCDLSDSELRDIGIAGKIDSAASNRVMREALYNSTLHGVAPAPNAVFWTTSRSKPPS